MQSWSDSFLNSVNDCSQILGLVALFLTFVFGYIVYATAKEATRRSAEREQAAEGRANDLQKKADEAIQRAQTLEARQSPRVITDEQRTQFVNALVNAPKGKVEVHIFNQDAEITQYANQIKSMLTAAGYDTGKMVGISFGSTVTPVGVFVVVKDSNAQPPFAGAIQQAFISIGINAQGAVDPTLRDGDKLMVIVGTKND